MVHLISCACDGRPFHLHRYLDEAMFRYNNNGTKDNPLNDAEPLRSCRAADCRKAAHLAQAENALKKGVYLGPLFPNRIRPGLVRQVDRLAVRSTQTYSHRIRLITFRSLRAIPTDRQRK